MVMLTVMLCCLQVNRSYQERNIKKILWFLKSILQSSICVKGEDRIARCVLDCQFPVLPVLQSRTLVPSRESHQGCLQGTDWYSLGRQSSCATQNFLNCVKKARGTRYHRYRYHNGSPQGIYVCALQNVCETSLHETKPLLFGESPLFSGLFLLTPCYALVSNLGHKTVNKKSFKYKLFKSTLKFGSKGKAEQLILEAIHLIRQNQFQCYYFINILMEAVKNLFINTAIMHVVESAPRGNGQGYEHLCIISVNVL